MFRKLLSVFVVIAFIAGVAQPASAFIFGCSQKPESDDKPKSGNVNTQRQIEELEKQESGDQEDQQDNDQQKEEEDDQNG